MTRTVRCGLIQAANQAPADNPVARIKEAMVRKPLPMIGDAARRGVQILCLQEDPGCSIHWQFYRDRRPERYASLSRALSLQAE